ncbi:MAG: chromosome segregation protein SMC [Candidatus Aadella gelida]|nr:chromosome segregation protein SMC [Candidatus Aadella gelida]
MHFKKLEIVGFKSFLNKTKLKFEPGVTAVVGPNGCGKSNIVDAIKWVLGEQSTKSMRSSSMQDVIFNGTDKYEPVNVAEVALTLSNEDRSLPVDYDEVVISRRLYRSGESEYLLNKTPVRLTDVRNLIMGTGIGTSSYSIVEQGRMDMILSSKPEERRYVFEEASGITRYKAKKREAMLKLERTQENLTRINDITREVERQITAIERKARKAERYKVRYDELKELDTKFAYDQYMKLGSDDASVKNTGNENRLFTEKLEEELRKAEGELNGEREKFNAIWEDLQKTQNEIMSLKNSIDKNEHVIEINTERISESEKNTSRLKLDIEELSVRRQSLAGRLETLEVRFKDINENRKVKEEEFASVEKETDDITREVNSYKHELRMGREKTVDLVSEQTKTRNMQIRVNADMQNAQARQKRLNLEKHNVENEKDNVYESFKVVEEENSSAVKELQEKGEEARVFNEEYSAKQHELSELNKNRSEKEKRLNEIKPRRQFLEKLISERAGIKESVKVIMSFTEKGDERFSGVHGILSELINVKESHEESLSFLLGEVSQALVVENSICASRVVSYLQDNSMENVNLIILEDLIKPGSGVKTVLPEGASDITEVLAADEPYGTALRLYLKDTFVDKSGGWDDFRDKNSGSDVRIIGEKGEVYGKGFRRSRNFSEKEPIPFFGREEKAEQLRAEELEVQGKIQGLEESIRIVEEWLKEASLKRDSIESELREKRARVSEVSSRRAVIKEKCDSLDEELLVLRNEIEEEMETVKRLQEEDVRLTEMADRLEAETFRMQESLEEAQRFIQDSSHKREELLFRMADSKAELSSFIKEEENLSYNLGREREHSERISRESAEKGSRIEEYAERILRLTEEKVVLSEQVAGDREELEVRNSEMGEKMRRKEDMSEVIREHERNLKAKENELDMSRNKSRDLDIRKKELEYKREALANKIMDAYKVDIARSQIELEGDINWDEMIARIDELKLQLEKMGDVSLSAVEEHKELEERFKFLSKHRDDLVESREALLKAITKINRTTRKLFMETFEAIKKEFNNYFRMLFNGGKGEIVLEDGADVLECGIDIIVRPPGKKLHNIMQLSGGEKAMTAIALIFAIFKVNPSPFCILDEIDAPLDESNIVRFCSVLQDFLKLSQFIIVTHNRMTIQLADVLYGITMEEKGISKIVSVKFTEETDVNDKNIEPVAV